MEDKQSEAMTEFKPGETIRPTGDASLPPVVAPQPTASVPTPPPTPVVTPPAPTLQAQTPPVVQAAPATVVQTPAASPPPQPTVPEPVEAYDSDQITWTASEFMDHAKSADWYLALAVVAILSAAALYVLFRDIITSATPIVAALALGFYGRRKPRQLQYRISSDGLDIGQRHLPYDTFRSFAVMDEGPFTSLEFLPLKRFGMLTTVFMDPQDEDRILDLVSQHLPIEPREHDPLDRFMKRIRF